MIPVTTRRENGATVLEFVEPVLLGGVGRGAVDIEEALIQVTTDAVILSFVHVQMLSSAALGALLRVNKHIVATGRRVVLVGMSDNVFNVFATTRLTGFFEIEPTIADALRLLERDDDEDDDG